MEFFFYSVGTTSGKLPSVICKIGFTVDQ